MSTFQTSHTDTNALPILAFSIVVYREVLSNTSAFTSLIAALSYSDVQTRKAVFVYDNTDQQNWNVTGVPEQSNVDIFYCHNPNNPGISVAYNHLSKMAQEQGYQWMVFLDQDTILPITAARDYMSAITAHPQTLIKAPVLSIGRSVFSPSKMYWKRTIQLRSVQAGIRPLKNYVFVNSGLLVSLPFFFSVGGYNECVQLDFTDFLFLERVKRKTTHFEILPFSCEHNFSHDEQDISKALKRYSIFAKDLRNCPKPKVQDRIGYTLVDILHLAKLTIRYKSLDFIKIRMRQQ